MANEKKDAVAVDETAELRATVAALAAQVATLTKAQTQSGGITADQLEAVMSRLLQVQAEAQLQAAREAAEYEQKENLRYPRISAYNPRGDKDHPRPQFKCPMYWVAGYNEKTGEIFGGYDLEWDTTTADEIDLLNRIEPGHYTFYRTDGRTPETLHVGGERGSDGTLRSLRFAFRSKEQRDTLPSMLSMLRDALGVKSAEQLEIERLKGELAKLRPSKAVA